MLRAGAADGCSLCEPSQATCSRTGLQGCRPSVASVIGVSASGFFVSGPCLSSARPPCQCDSLAPVPTLLSGARKACLRRLSVLSTWQRHAAQATPSCCMTPNTGRGGRMARCRASSTRKYTQRSTGLTCTVPRCTASRATVRAHVRRLPAGSGVACSALMCLSLYYRCSALRRKIGGTYKDFMKEYVEVMGPSKTRCIVWRTMAWH